MVLLILHVSLPAAGHAMPDVDHPHAYAAFLTPTDDLNIEQSADFHSHDHQHALAVHNKIFCACSLLHTEQRLTGLSIH